MDQKYINLIENWKNSPIFNLFSPFSNAINQKMGDFDNFSAIEFNVCHDDLEFDNKFGSDLKYYLNSVFKKSHGFPIRLWKEP